LTIVVVGAGIAGLACAIRLRHQGHRVVVLEKNERAGGRCDVVQENGFTFNTGPTLLMLPEFLDQLFQDVGRCREDYLELLPIDPAYRITFNNGKTFDFSRDLKVLEKELLKFGKEEVAGFYRFLIEAGESFRFSMPNFINRPANDLSRLVRPKVLSFLFESKPWRSVYDVVAQYVKSPELRMAFSFQTLYLGISPLECTSIYTILPYIDLVHGIFYPKGGMHQIPLALTELFQDMGGELRCSAEVDQIVHSRGTVKGVKLSNGDFLSADIVVSNVDLLTTYRRLLHNDGFVMKSAGRMEKMRNSCSCAVFLWGLNRTYPSLRHHNLLLPISFERTLKDIFEKGRIPEEPAYYICAASKSDPSSCPPGHESVMVLVPVPNQTARLDWDQEIPLLRQKVIAHLEKSLMPRFSSHIVYKKVCDPRWYARSYALGDAATFGFAPTFFQSAMFRPQHRSSEIKGLYFAGASTHPGNGVPIVLISGRLAAEAIKEDWPRPVIPESSSPPIYESEKQFPTHA